MEVFAVNHAFPFSKMLTFYRKEPFDLEASYGKNVNLPLKDGFIGKFNGRGFERAGLFLCEVILIQKGFF